MRAWRLESTGRVGDGDGPLRYREVERPSPDRDEVLIRVEACAVCHTELDQIEGRVETPLPRIPGHEVVGEVVEIGDDVDDALSGTRVGVGWIGGACGECRFCERGAENLCPDFRGTGRDLDGGYAEYMVAPAAFVVPVPDALEPAEAAPMLCAGAIGLRSLRLANLADDQVLGLTGFGAANHLVLAMALARDPDRRVVVFARDAGQREQAIEMGAAWAGDTHDDPPQTPDAIIDTTPVWTTVLAALERLAPGGRLVINAISKEDDDRDRLAGLDYESQLWKEKEIKSVANVTRRDLRGVLELVAEHGLRAEIRRVGFDEANEALKALKRGGNRGALVLEMNGAD
ncbi:MAG: alcohol dehydrogenase catalytic domain-containing protein [Wenzhouxiangellaceae bacterium]|nr:alcohol dehydrogenase catalytic domain-containing protein [Wenzhouxiangellaceae bacterium]